VGTSSKPPPAGDPSREKRRLEAQCPTLVGKPYRVTSPSSKAYNCLAWANCDWHRYWSPQPNYYWPLGLLREDTTRVEVLEDYFRAQGFQPCDSVARDPSVEKVAIFGDARGANHVARRPANGDWLSKMGDGADIEHAELDWVECGLYGSVRAVMCRRAHEGERQAPRPAVRLILNPPYRPVALG
jgi:hypothetical protein